MKNFGPAGLALLKSFEQCRLEAYPDQGGIWTIGWGHTGPDVVQGLKCNQAQADAWLVADTARAAWAVNTSLTPEAAAQINQNQFDALTCFTFNVGIKAEAHSTMLTLINNGRFREAADEFPKWNHVNGAVSAGLSRRRAAEQALFLQGS